MVVLLADILPELGEGLHEGMERADRSGLEIGHVAGGAVDAKIAIDVF